ncbi:hypothetical protein ACOSQ4_013979 [Xanthoceras sorbifolium]
MYGNRDMIQEKGIDLEELWNTFVPMVVNQRGWGKFVQQPIRASYTVILEFYATMIPDVFMNDGPVNVKGRQVAITVEAINEYYMLENDLRTSGEGTWLSNRAVLKIEELHLDSAFWNEFCLYSLFPKSSRSMVSPVMAYVH